MAHTHHAIDYVELAATDVAQLKEFYSAAFGWEFNDYGPAYAGIRSPDGEGEVGGLNGMVTPLGPTPGGPLVLLFSADLDATASTVESAGGKVVDGPYEFPG